jgi:predicted DNA-binding transcriptional regulator AlpA
MIEAPQLLAPKDVAKRLSCSLSMLYREVKLKKFPRPM